MSDDSACLKATLVRIEGKLDAILSNGAPTPICSVCGFPIGPADAYGDNSYRPVITIGPDGLRRHNRCPARS